MIKHLPLCILSLAAAGLLTAKWHNRGKSEGEKNTGVGIGSGRRQRWTIEQSMDALLEATSNKEDDIRCLQGFKNSLKDPQNRLASWNFINTTAGAVCKYDGVTCWSENEDRLIAIELLSMELGGEIPDSLQFCQSLQSLTLSGNGFSGSIPSQICEWLPFLVKLDLSNNDLSGPIPPELRDCEFLNALSLDTLVILQI
ncbi:hypothetical protein IFM89_012993 [Coptis chinensis]|uniref:Leucine-rich repeat-containing N-terminal plant-type domain-containing protein n=1 Tax=Coptis chinensis TaxID=261450 RepID=A0A835M9W3_9MAGN|nr:hypothetical protein IFM89_012993 [Coptis chinensis]